ncbi:MAG: LAGLIDADG family homing endonuclease [Nanoarchaeota archaeon]|nr:LAGLIDADG family homing endonuclease [Nanoarchaeota archaeon]
METYPKKKGFYYIRICGDSEKDKAYLLDYVKPLIKKLFGLDMGTYQHKKNKELYLTIGSKDLLFTLKNYGLKSGNKIKNKACIPLWVFKSKNHLKACIRGLIDTDGSVIPITGRNYPYIWFTCGSPTLRKDFKKAMSILGYKTSKWNFNGTPETYIGSKKLIQKFYKEIGFSNPKHINRFCSGGVVRSN